MGEDTFIFHEVTSFSFSQTCFFWRKPNRIVMYMKSWCLFSGQTSQTSQKKIHSIYHQFSLPIYQIIKIVIK